MRSLLALLQTAIPLLACFAAADVSQCTTTIEGSIPLPTTAPDTEIRLVQTGLTYPRGIVFDRAGHLLVVDRGVGVRALTLRDDGGACVFVQSMKTIIDDPTLNHGIELSEDQDLLWVSNPDKVYQFRYNPAGASIDGPGRTIVKGMDNKVHSTRTILRSRKRPNTILLNRGSESNIDALARRKATGHSQIKAFNLNQLGAEPFDFTQDGRLMGWGLRNNVGLAEHPDGGIWSVENSVDNISRNGKGFKNRNPGEKLNYFGTLINNKSPNQGSNFGYPDCFAAWAPADVPSPPANLKVGQQFSINPSVSDAQCRNRTAPRLVFDAHTAPLDIKFGPAARYAYMTFHGSHNRAVPKGFSVARVEFGANGEPVAARTSRSAQYDIAGQKDRSSCPGRGCLRPAGLAFDDKARLFFTSDGSGEIYILRDTSGAQL